MRVGSRLRLWKAPLPSRGLASASDQSCLRSMFFPQFRVGSAVLRTRRGAVVSVVFPAGAFDVGSIVDCCIRFNCQFAIAWSLRIATVVAPLAVLGRLARDLRLRAKARHPRACLCPLGSPPALAIGRLSPSCWSSQRRGHRRVRRWRRRPLSSLESARCADPACEARWWFAGDASAARGSRAI